MLISHSEQVWMASSSAPVTLAWIQLMHSIFQCTAENGRYVARKGWPIRSTEGLAKQKSIPLKQSKEVATREVFSHAGHPLTPQFRHAARMSSLLERWYMWSFFTLNVLNQEHLIEGFLKPAREYFKTQGVAIGGGGAGCSTDVPLPKKKKKSSRHEKSCTHGGKPMLDLQRGAKEVHFSISKTANKKLDEVGVKGTNL